MPLHHQTHHFTPYQEMILGCTLLLSTVWTSTTAFSQPTPFYPSVSFIALASAPAEDQIHPSAVLPSTSVDSHPTSSKTTFTSTASKDLLPPILPSQALHFGPSMARLAPGEVYDREVHANNRSCRACHEDIYEEWQDSTHAFASFNNPFYRVSFDTFAEDAGLKKTAHCAGCHDPTLLFDKTILRAIVQPDEPRAHLGVTCTTCHGITDATADGNGSYVLSTLPIPLPASSLTSSTTRYQRQLRAHSERVAPSILRSNTLCAACHKGFLSSSTGHPVVISGLNEFSPYRRSAYNNNHVSRIDSPVSQKRCVDCHMPTVGSTGRRSHRFVGGHTTLAATIGAETQLDQLIQNLRSAASIDIAAMGVGKISPQQNPLKMLQKDEKLWIDVVVYNDGTGHQFPGGALDLRDTWIEVVLEDAEGHILAQAGTNHGATGDDHSAVQLRAVVADATGHLVEGHRVHSFRTPVANHSIAPRDALVSRYLWRIPSPAPALPLKAKARLRHRRLHHRIQKLACEATQTSRGKSFVAHTQKFSNKRVQPCVKQPIITIGETFTWLGKHPPAPSKYPSWRRHWHRGLGLLHNLGENLEEAIDAFTHTLQLIPNSSPDLHRAMVLFSLGLAQAHQRRLDTAMETWSRAEKLAPRYSALHFARGNAHQQTFRNQTALGWYTKAAQLANDDRIWRAMAISAGSIMDPSQAYQAARHGLLLESRNPTLLRSQMLALRSLRGPKHPWTVAATQAFVAYKQDEQLAIIKDKCSRQSSFCSRLRQPLIKTWMLAP